LKTTGGKEFDVVENETTTSTTTTTFDDFLGQMAHTAIEVLRSAHNEDLKMVEDEIRPKPETIEPEIIEPEMMKFKRREELICQLKKSTQFFWGNEKCNL